MNLVKWDPFREWEDISSRLGRVFGRSPDRSEPEREMLTLADWAPSTDIAETDEAYFIKAEIPGVKREDVKVTVQDGMLTLQGERKMEKEEKGKRFHRIECCYGKFVRSFLVPNDVEESSVRAEFKDGMLYVTLAKTARATSKAIKVTVT
jgi:HSP20 family protein